MTKPSKIVYTAHASATGGREGQVKSNDGLLDVKLITPKEMGGAGGGVNPEQLFAAGYAACFIGAMKFVSGQEKITLPVDTKIEGLHGLAPRMHGGTRLWIQEATDLLGRQSFFGAGWNSALRCPHVFDDV